ncbi:hypothetical protein WUBG_15545, partial [Wuchereria bancrofti]
KRNKRQYYGSNYFGYASIPFFSYGWGRNYGGWSGPYSWGMPWHPFVPAFRRPFWGGYHDGFGYYGGFGGPWFG